MGLVLALTQNAGDFFPADQNVVGPLQRRYDPSVFADGFTQDDAGEYR